jgi:acyl-CoA thioester hydrolase
MGNEIELGSGSRLNQPGGLLSDTLNINVRFSDLDAMGHVNNARYLTYFEEGRAAWFHRFADLPTDSFDYPVIVARIEIDYLEPISLGCELKVETTCVRLGTKSLDFHGSISICGEPDRLASRYKAVMVWYDYGLGQSVPIPENIRRQFSSELQKG